MEHVEPQKRHLADASRTQKDKLRVRSRGDQTHAVQFQERRPGAFHAHARCRSRHVRADRDRPDRELVPGQQVARERQQQGQHQKYDADPPVELARRLVAPRQEDAIHVQPDGDHHGVSTPAMQLAHDAQRRHVPQRQNIVVGVLQRGPVIKHEQDARHDLHDEEEERRPSHAPRIRQRDALLAHADRMKVQEEIGEHHHHAVAPIGRHRVAEDALPELGFRELFQDWHGGLYNSGRYEAIGVGPLT